MDWIQQWQSKLNKQNGVAPLVRTGGSRHTGLAALPYRNIQGSCRMDCAEACPLPDQEGCHPMKHCQPPWRRQSEPEISSEFRVQLRSEDPGRFSGAGSAAFSGWRLAMRKACCPQRAGKSGQTEAFMADRCM